MARRSIYDHCRLLGKDSIRLLRIVRTSPVLVLSLHPYRLTEAPNFYALSYTWGNPLPPLAPETDVYNKTVKCVLTSEDVECNVDVTRNLFDALCSLARKSISGPLWVDAVCINQGNRDEREEQVAIMGQIYASSKEVIVWLGPISDLDEDAVTLHNEFIPALRKHYGGFLPGPEVLKAISLDRLIELGVLSSPQALKSYEWFRRRAWFQRAWTFQEAFLAHRIKILYDVHVIEWHNLMDMAYYDLNLHQTVTIQELVPEAHQLGMPTSLRGLENLRATFSIGSQDNAIRFGFNTNGGVNLQPEVEESSIESQRLMGNEDDALQQSQKRVKRAYFLMAFVNSIRYRRCTDLRDKVFAAIGSANYLFPPTCEADVFSIRYDVSVERLYESFTTWLLRYIPLMHILSLVEEVSKRSLTSLPSWVPDFSVTTQLEELTNEMTVEEGFSKSPSASHTVSVVDEKQRLHVIGRRLGVIDRVDAVPVADILPSKHQHVRALSEFCQNMKLDYPTGEGRVEALWRTLVMNTDRSSPSRLAGRRSGLAQPGLGLCFRSLILSLVTMRVLHVFNENPVSGNGNDILDVISKATGEILMTQFGIGHCSDASVLSREILPSKDEVDRRLFHHLSQIGRKEVGTTASGVLASADDEPWRFITSLRTEGRRLFRTNGGWIGLAPRSSQVGDEVWSFKESKIPYILRPLHAENGIYNFIGESYLHGIAAGEELPQQKWTEATVLGGKFLNTPPFFSTPQTFIYNIIINSQPK